MASYDPKRARAKRPLPLWVDAFQRDTMTFEPDEVGAYLRLLMAMWSARGCALPDDDRRLARAAGVSVRTWSRRIGPLIRPLLSSAGDGLVTQRRLLREADFVESELARQSAKGTASAANRDSQSRLKRGNLSTLNRDSEDRLNSANPLETHEPASTAVDTAEPATEPTAEPTFPTTQQPNSRESNTTTIDKCSAREPDEGSDGGGGARQVFDLTHRERLLHAMGLDASGLTGRGGARLGTTADMEIARRWQDDLGLSPDEQCAVIGEVMQRKPDGAPSSFRYFSPAMQRLAGAKQSPPLHPTPGARPHGTATFDDALRETVDALRAGQIRFPDD